MNDAAMTKKGTANSVVEFSSSSIFWAMPTSGLPSMANIVPAETPRTSQIGRPMPSRTKKMAANTLVMIYSRPEWTSMVAGSNAKQNCQSLRA